MTRKNQNHTGQNGGKVVEGRGPLERISGLVFGCILAAAGIAIFNQAGPLFEVSGGVSLLFPASAVAVLAGLFLGWWGVAAVFVGYLLTPWGLATTIERTVFFAVVATVQAAIPAVAVDRLTVDRYRCLYFLGTIAVLPALASALLALPAVIVLSQPRMGPLGAFTAFGGWFSGDLIAILILAVPVVLIFRPEMALNSDALRLYRRWSQARSRVARPLAGVLMIGLGMELALRFGLFGVHWIAVLLLIPILSAAVWGGVGAALMINSAAGITYVVEVIRFQSHQAGTGLFGELFSSYLSLLVFVGAALVVGVAWGNADVLLRELDEHRRLLQENFERVVTALAAAVEAKDPLTEGHVQRVAKLAVAVGSELGMEGRRLEMLRYAALLHDVGKIGVPEQILNKRGPLTPEEREIVERHVTVGVEIIESVDILKPAIPIIRYHQERWDGQTDTKVVQYPGYFGLKGEEIPLEARIIAVVDTWDAITSDRPYRAALPTERALEEIKTEAGKQFDPRVVAALTGIILSKDGIQSSDRIRIVGDDLPEWLADPPR